MSLHAAAEGIVALGNAQMVRALELVSVERGFDPRDFSMVAFGIARFGGHGADQHEGHRQDGNGRERPPDDRSGGMLRPCGRWI